LGLGDDSAGPAETGYADDGGANGDGGSFTNLAHDAGTVPTQDAGGPPLGSGSLTAGTTTLTMTVAGYSRSVLLHVPSAVTGHELPLVIALHGDGDTSANFVSETTTLEAKSDADGFVLAAPQGITRDVVVGSQTVPSVDWDPYNDAPTNIDLPLLDQIRTQLVATGSIDPKNISVYGYSQGGFMSFRYGMTAAANLSCAAVLAAGDPFGGEMPALVTGAARKIPVSIQIGTDDSLLSTAQAAKTELTTNGNPLDYHEISGAGHVPVPGDFSVPLDDCRGRSLP
jgi:poly(3-hydroxybutyrate) depolymerase